MRRLLVAVLTACLAWSCSGTLTARGAAATGFSPSILVGLTRTVGVVVSPQRDVALLPSSASADPSAFLVVPAGTRVGFSVASVGVSWEFTPANGATQVGQSAGPVYLGIPPTTAPGTPAGPSQASPEASVLTIAGLRNPSPSLPELSFRGSLIIIPSAGVLLVVNAVDIEDYIQSVVGGEIPDGWPTETVRAQAIAARSYAAYKTGLTGTMPSKDYARGFRTLTAQDVKIWASDQVYKGVVEENPESVEATKATRGKILTYSGSPIAAYFHSDAGGMTEDPCYVWGGSVPYLQPVSEVPHESPYSSWTVSLSEQDVLSGLFSLGLRIDALPDLITGHKPGTSGRWAGVMFPTATGSQAITATSLRGAFPAIRSLLFSSYAYGGGKPTRAQLGPETGLFVQADGKLVQDIRVGSSCVVGDGGAVVRNSGGAFAVTGVTVDSPTTYVLQGRGWGHGVGLSQHGAKAMALMGSKAEDILGLYYPGTLMEEWWQ